MDVDDGDGRPEERGRELFGFGQNACGELGLGDAVERYTPTLSHSSRGKGIVHVTAGNELTAVLTNTGEVYCCGYNTEGQCGIGEIDGAVPDTVPSLTKVVVREPSFRPAGRVVLVNAGNGCEHLLLVTEDGALHTCGCNDSGQLGHGDVNNGYSLPTRLGHLARLRVAKVACSYSHTVVVTEDDQTWTFGGNQYGQLGHGDKNNRSVPAAVPCFQGAGVVSVSCGVFHTVVSVAGGGFFSFGKNDHGQLGLEGDESRLAPARHKTCTGVIEQLACGYYHTAALSKLGEVFAFGRNDYGQLGLGHRESTWQGGLIPDLAGKVIIQVACGSYHTISLDIEGRVYPFGRNNHGQLGTGTREDSCRPCYVEELSGKFVCQVAAGFYHTLCLTGPALPRKGQGGALLCDVVHNSRSLSSDLYRLLNNPSRSDVTFVVEGKPIYGHRCIIGARCEPLERMLEGPMKEAWAVEGSIPLPNHRHAVFLAFLEFLYTDKVNALGADVLDLDFWLDLMDVSDQYLVGSLKRLCEDAVLRNITVDNACELLVAAESRLASSLRESSLPSRPLDLFVFLVHRVANAAAMDTIALVQFIYEAGNELVARCESVKQCHSEAARIALRTVRTLGVLEGASGEFSGSVPFNASLNELKATLVQTTELVKRCQRPRGVIAKALALARVNANKAELVNVEADLERIMRDLNIPMLTDIRSVLQEIHAREMPDSFDEGALHQAVQAAIHQELNAHSAHRQGSVRDVIQAKLSSSDAAAPTSGSDTGGQLMFRLGRVRFDKLEEDDEILGEGTFGVVHGGTYMGEEVAVKKARGTVGDPAVLREFRREAETHFAMRHDNIVRLLAFSEGSPQRPPCMVLERMEESLSTFLKVMKSPPSLEERLETTRHICQGLLFLHQHRIIHCDVKSANVLFDQAGNAKLSDFGLAVVAATVASSTSSTATNAETSQVGTVQYMAPEVHAGSKPTFASDVFSLHVVTWEVLTHQRIGNGFPIGYRIRHSPDAKLIIGDRVPATHRDDLQAILDQCGRLDGKERPEMELVLRTVNSVLHKVKDARSSAEAAARDRIALIQLFKAAGGTLWTISSEWGTSAPLDKWHGVTVPAVIPSDGVGNDAARVIKLDLSNNALRGPIPAEIGGLTALQRLWLHQNQLSGPIPAEIGGLTALQRLWLHQNQLSVTKAKIKRMLPNCGLVYV
eukprot:g13558.t2